MRIPSRTQNIVVGLALIVMPLLAIVLKLAVYPGWMVLILFISGIPLLLGYVIQVVIAATSMFRSKGVFNTVPGAMRGVVAAWITSISVLLSTFFLIDGGDSGEGGSAFTLLFTGGPSTAETEGL